MNATEITVIGNVVNSPNSYRTPSGSKVTNFRLAATERRYDGATQGFVNGNTFWIDVECWDELGGNVSQSVAKGDPVVVVGTISTHQWETDEGHRSKPRIKARAVAPNLARGISEFKKIQRRSTSVGEDGEAAADVPNDAEGEAEFVEGRDYERDLSALDDMDPDASVPEPAFG